MSRSPSRSARAVLVAAALGWTLPASLVALPAGLAERASARLAELGSRSGYEAPEELLTRNLSRYFVRYLLPSDPAELRRVLGTAERTTARAAIGLHRTLQAGAARLGVDAVRPELVDSLFAEALPMASDRFGETRAFVDRAVDRQVVVDTIDFEVLADTGFAWRVLGALDAAAAAPGDELRPLTVEAIDAFHRGVNAYALLLWRIAGLEAKAEKAAHVESRHLRAAAKSLADGALSERVAADRVVAAAAPADDPFTEITDAAGFVFRHVTSDWLARYRRYGPVAPSFSGGGVAAGDVDGDGWDDLVVCGGRGCATFVNRRDGTLREATAELGIAHDGEARMPLLADFDNDGDRDLFVTYARDSNRLWANEGGRFRDVTSTSGLERDGDISGPAIAFDADGDGRLDLLVGNFGDYLSGETPWQAGGARNGQPNRLYLNRGDLRFEEQPPSAGVGDTGWAQAISHADLDRDGDQDVYIANDFGPNELLLNDGSGRFAPRGRATGSDDRNHGMNVSFADLNGDSLADLMVTNLWFYNLMQQAATETNTLLLSDPDGEGLAYLVHDDPAFVGLDTGWAWAAPFFDYDHDGSLDLFIANGFTDYLTFVQKRPHPEIEGAAYPIHNAREPNWLLRGSGPLSWTPVETSLRLAGVNARSAALFDLDRDGDLDLALTAFHDRARLFRNDASAAGGWLQLELVGDPARGVPRDAIGAQLVVRGDGGQRWWRTIAGGDGYLGQSSLVQHVGTGGAATVDVEVLWPGGAVETFSDLVVDRRWRLPQGGPAVVVDR